MRPLPTLALLWLAAGGAAQAQTSCPPPVLRVLRDHQEVPATGAAFAPIITLAVAPNPACGAGGNYRFREAEITLMRGRRPAMPTLLVHRPEVNLTELTGSARPGDRICFFVSYQNLFVVAADGKLHPYPRPALSPGQQTGVGNALLTDEDKGISFNWLLGQK